MGGAVIDETPPTTDQVPLPDEVPPAIDPVQPVTDQVPATGVPQMAIIDCATGEQIVRDMTDEEIAVFLAAQEAAFADPITAPINDPVQEVVTLREQVAALTARLEAAGL